MFIAFLRASLTPTTRVPTFYMVLLSFFGDCAFPNAFLMLPVLKA